MNEGLNKDEFFGRITDLSIGPMEYYRLIGSFNILIQSELIQKLSENGNKLGDIATFVTPGSDGRLEKGSFVSPLEIVAITNDTNLDLKTYKDILVEILDKISTTPIAKIVDIKGPQSSMVTFRDRYQPGRIADSRLIQGSPQFLKDIKIRLGRDIIGLRGNEVDKIVSLKKDARKVTERGVNRIAGTDAIHFDLESGTIFFNPEAYQLSFKVGPLRLVQNTLLIEEVKHIRREKDENFISNLDSNIVNRLDQLSDDKMLNLTKASVDEIAEHYAFFLRLYHKSERAYAQNKQVAVQLTPNEITEVSHRIKALSKLLERFEVKKQPC